jgi:hypothetical protein
MARSKTSGARHTMAPLLGGMRRCILAWGFREGLREGLKRLGETKQGVFREVRLAGFEHRSTHRRAGVYRGRAPEARPAGLPPSASGYLAISTLRQTG